MVKKVSTAIFIIIGIIIIFNLGKQIATALNSGNRLDQAVSDLGNLQAQNQQLRQELVRAQSYEYIEKTARDELNMAKPNETVVIIPENVLDQVMNPPKKPEPPKVPNWQRWLQLIFHRWQKVIQ